MSPVLVPGKWLVPAARIIDDYSDTAESVATFRALFDQAVADRLPSHGPAAIMLSGGMDSGPAAESAARQLQVSEEALHPVSWRLANPRKPTRAIGSAPCVAISNWNRSGLTRNTFLLASSTIRMISPDRPTFNAFRHLVNACYCTAAESGCSVILNGNAGDNLYMPFHLLYRAYWKDGDWRLIRRDLAHIFSRGGWRALASHRPLRHYSAAFAPVGERPAMPEWLHAAVRPDWRLAHESQPRFDGYPFRNTQHSCWVRA